LDFGRNSDPRLECIWQRLATALPRIDPRLRDLQFVDGSSGRVPAVVRNGVTLAFEELSDGYQSLLVILFDLALRYPYLFGALDSPLEGHALVAIDEIDLHLHPRWQRTVVSQLVGLFPNTQLVITTHSPVVVQGAIDTNCKIVSLRERDGGVEARALGSGVLRRLCGAEVGSVLLEKILFGVESRYSTRFSAFERRADELQQRVSSATASEEEYEELSRILEIMEGLLAREDERRADTSTVAQMARMRAAFVKDLIAELKKARS